MILRLYFIILLYFAVGVIAFYFINRNKEKSIARKSWGKTIIYFIIIQIVFFTIIINPIVFRYLAVIIIIMGFYELFKLFKDSVYIHKTVFIVSLVIFGVFAWGFYVVTTGHFGVLFELLRALLGRNRAFRNRSDKVFWTKKRNPLVILHRYDTRKIW